MENKRNHECRKCGGTGKPSKAFVNYHHIDKSYLRGEKEFEDKILNCIKCGSCGHSWIPEKSTREQALAWWNNLPNTLRNGRDKQSYYDNYKANNYTVAENYSQLTGREIEIIFKIETKHIDPSDIEAAYRMNPTTQVVRDAMKAVSKDVIAPKSVRNNNINLNQKQFKQFNESLFKAYINKFSDEDKLTALKILFWSLNNKNQFHVVEIGIDKL